MRIGLVFGALYCAVAFAVPLDPPVLVVDLADGAAGSGVQQTVTFGGSLYFVADDGDSGMELWRSDGSAAGTLMVADIVEDGASNPNDLTPTSSRLFFTADDGIHDRELWATNGGTAALVKDIRAESSSSPRDLVALGTRVLFSADDGVHGRELWVSDGTESGTTMVVDLHPSGGSFPQYLTVYNGAVYFSASGAAAGQELWVSDGTAAGTTLIKDIHPTGHSSPQFLTVANNLLFFSAFEPVAGQELWRSDGTSEGTQLVHDIRPGGQSFPMFLTEVGQQLFFSADDGVHGRELWRTNGASAGTALVCDGEPGPFGSFPEGLTAGNNGAVFFTAAQTATDRELWWSDGTEAGTRMVKDIRHPGTSQPGPILFANGLAYFRANDQVAGSELWVSNGTEGGTLLVEDIREGIEYSSPDNCVTMAGTLYFTADDGEHGRELWSLRLPEEDLTPPAITVIGANPFRVEQGNAYVDPGATAFDNIDGNISAQIVTTNPVNTGTPATYTVTYSVSDFAGNSAFTTRTVDVLPNQPPVITLTGGGEIDHEVSTEFVDPGYLAIDNVDGNITGQVVVTGTVDSAALGDYALHYNVSDAAGNAAVQATRIVHVVDSTAPLISLIGGAAILIEQHVPFIDPGYAAIDNHDGDVSASVIVTGTVDTSTLGEYALTYTVSDSAGNEATAERTVTVMPEEAPVLTLLGANPFTLYLNEPFVDPGYSAIDNVDGDITPRVVVEGVVNTATPGTYAIQYRVSDVAGHTVSAERLVNVLAPVGVYASIGLPDPRLTVRGPVHFDVTYTNASQVFLSEGMVSVETISGNSTGTVAVELTGTARARVTVRDIRGEGSLAIRIAAGSAIGLDGSLAPAFGPSVPVKVLRDTDGDGILDDIELLVGTNPFDYADRPTFWHFVKRFDAQGNLLYGSVGETFFDGDMNLDRLPDRYETALVAYMLSDLYFRFNAAAQDAFLEQLDILRDEPEYGEMLSATELVLTALQMTGHRLGGYWHDALGLTGNYSVFFQTKSAGEPLSGMGDFDGDFLTNLEEYETVLGHGGGIWEYVLAATKASRNGLPVPAAGRFGWLLLTLLIGLVGAGAGHLRRGR